MAGVGDVVLDTDDIDYETEHDSRKRQIAMQDPVHTIVLKDYVQSQVNSMALQLGDASLLFCTATILERRPAEIVVFNSGKRSVDGLYKLLQTDVQGKPAYERLRSKNKPRFRFFKKRWTIGGALGLQRSGFNARTC